MAPSETDGYSDMWEQRWQAGIEVGQAFDACRSAPSLVSVLESEQGQALCMGKQAVVPGCGRGYDLVTLLKYGATKVTGMEISETAADVARKYVASQVPDAVANGAISIELGDWLDPGQGAQEFDLGYDYTFFCALHPDMRKAWGEGWGRRIKSGGSLIALAFPITTEQRQGPPWPLQLSDYEAALGPCGFKLVKQEKVTLEATTAPGREGKEIITVWEKQ